jgi:hypothetical protein
MKRIILGILFVLLTVCPALAFVDNPLETYPITQNVVADASNSSTGNLAAGATFTGLMSSTLGVAGIQISFKSDQNATIYVEQSGDTSPNWDISDSYNYYASRGNFGITVQAISSYVRVRVTNTGTSTTTYFRLQTALCPIVEALPRSLDTEGNLKVAVKSTTDDYGFSVENTPTDEMRVSQPYRLVGATFTNVHDINFWTQLAGVSQNYVYGGAQVILDVSGANTSAILQSARYARYIGASANRYRSVIRFPEASVANNYRRWGAFDASSGAYFEVSGNSTLSVVTRKATVNTKVSGGSFNGVLGSTVLLDASVNTWEIYWTNSKVFFVRGGKLLHTVTASSNTWSDTMNLPVRMENVNTNASATDVSMNVRVATIARLGRDQTQPTSVYTTGQTTGKSLKVGPGNLHSILIGGVANGATLTIYDGTSTAGNIIWATGVMPNNTNPFSIDFKNAPFYTGLFIVMGAANSNCTIIFE